MEYNDRGLGKCHQFNPHAFHSQINYFSLQTFCFLFELIKSWITFFSEIRTNKLIISEANIINYDHQNINCFNVSMPLHKTVHLMFSEIMFFSEQNSLQEHFVDFILVLHRCCTFRVLPLWLHNCNWLFPRKLWFIFASFINFWLAGGHGVSFYIIKPAIQNIKSFWMAGGRWARSFFE